MIFQIEAISHDKISKFTIEVNAVVQIIDPMIILNEQINDMGLKIENELSGFIKRLASEYTLNEAEILKEKIEQSLNTYTLLESGSKITNIMVIVELDSNYKNHLESERNIRYKEELEKKKAKAAKEVSSLYKDDITAVFSQVVDNKIDVVDAIQMIQKQRNENFEIKLEQVNQLTDYILKLEETDMEPILNAIMGEAKITSPDRSMKKIIEEENEYAPLLNDELDY